MKKFVVTLFAAAALTACKKNETTTVDRTTESTGVAAPIDSGMPATDTANTSHPTGKMSDLSDQDKKFADAAARGGMMEVMMGKLAETNASGQAVKSLGAMMVTDHTKANDELKAWASAIGYTLPNSLDAEKQKMYDDLKAKKGVDFDKKYTDLMVTDHKKDIAEFKKEASDGKEASLKSFASKTLPTLEHHLKESEKTKNGVK
ncbi:DUF4142 domain-containing protein [Chryseobacterium pennipullorum]|uniref:DUF4142 domain-containing protein n=1 Tax=Chryseobacterium pennipullorum TaxID=2258963 RepID=A0A3D9B9J4_9FLAO|nr:DUF4142 domain-containing protein [Chryseobacterium pennipullorum]REC50223.1 DUF4142 domain-containing protein [Chryseobacterium pennipullorum]